MEKQTLIIIMVLTLVAFVISNDVLAQSAAENEIIRITERVLDVVLGFFKAILDMLLEFFKNLIPFFGDDTTTIEQTTNS